MFENHKRFDTQYGVGTGAPRHGVLTLFGYGIQVRVDRGHLLIEDGIGEDRRKIRLARVGHGLKRLVCIGADGFISLAALQWLAAQDASFVLLERDGSVLTATGPVRPSDAKLRRAQALAHVSGAALRITRELIRQKLAGQESVARNTRFLYWGDAVLHGIGSVSTNGVQLGMPTITSTQMADAISRAPDIPSDI